MFNHGQDLGTTSACAENTDLHRRSAPYPGNYLRVRGEYKGIAAWPRNCAELPPRARRILWRTPTTAAHGGTTSACAENTHQVEIETGQKGNYLRVRGEYSASIVIESNRLELPPRARRIPLNKAEDKLAKGTTSACAENTTSPTPGIRKRGNYLRVRGEYRTLQQ